MVTWPHFFTITSLGQHFMYELGKLGKMARKQSRNKKNLGQVTSNKND